MKLKKSQKGMTFWSVSFILLLIGFVVFNVLKLLPVYMESFTIESAITSLETDRGQTFSGPLAVRSAIMKRLSINNATLVTKDDITVTRENNVYLVEVDYEARIPYFKNIDLLITFSHSARAQSN
jgi:hypothetical protein